MNIILNVILLLVGLVILINAANYFVDSAVIVAELSGIPKLIVGATIVSLATTLPELFVSTTAVLNGSNEMGIGNALGSFIFNTGVILSIAAIFMSGKVDRGNIIEKGTILILALTTLTVFSLDRVITWYEAIIQLLFILVFVYMNLKSVKKQREVKEKDHETNKGRIILIRSLILLASAAGIAFGSWLLVDNAETIAYAAGLSEQVVGLTILAWGTSLPELTTTITAVIKKQQSISIGNVIGANILNITMIMGVSGLVAKGGLTIVSKKIWPFTGDIPQTLFIDLPMAFIIILLFVLPIMKNGHLKRWQGIAGLSLYFVYLVFLLINAR